MGRNRNPYRAGESRKLSVVVSAEVYARLEELVSSRGVSLSSLVNRILDSGARRLAGDFQAEGRADVVGVRVTPAQGAALEEIGRLWGTDAGGAAALILHGQLKPALQQAREEDAAMGKMIGE